MKLYTFEECDYSNCAHRALLVRLLGEYMSDPMGDAPPLSEAEQGKLIEELSARPSATVIFAMDGEQGVGMAICFELFSTFKVKSYLYIHDFMVSKEYRGKGVGGALMNRVVELATSRGYCKITLEVRYDNTSAKALYRREGFVPCDPNMYFWSKKI